MVNYIRISLANIWVRESHFYFMWFCFHPLPVFPVFAILGNLADINFGIKISSKRFSMVAAVAVNNVEIMHFIEMVLRGISCVNAGHPRIEPATQHSHYSFFFETVVVCPL